MNNLNQMGGTPFTQRNSLSPYFNPTQGASASINNIVWVQGIEGARSWQLTPNSTIILLDNEVEGRMYIKVSDNIGMSSLRVFNFVEEQPSSADNVTNNKDLDLSNLVRKDELNTLIKEYLEKNERPVSTVATNTVATKPNVVVTKKQ
jgi:hypothetical protein